MSHDAPRTGLRSFVETTVLRLTFRIRYASGTGSTPPGEGSARSIPPTRR